MHVGDSATFALDAEEFYLNMMSYREVPEEIGDNKELLFDVKLISVRPEPDEMKADRMANESRRDSEMISIERFLEDKGYEVEPTETGLYYIDVEEGTGKQAEAGKKVKVHYTGTFLNGEKFDSSHDRNAPIEFTLGRGEVIKGWDEGIAMMKEGGKANLVIPSKLAYGSQARGTIKAYSPLFFEVELVEVID
jgi:peptidylprolyl isomerase